MRTTILSYPLKFTNNFSHTLKMLSSLMCESINEMWNSEAILEELSSGRKWLKVYKVLEPIVNFNNYLPSRVKRCMLETMGRILKSQLDRRALFNNLCALTSNPDKWTYEFLKKHGLTKKYNYIKNIRRQTQRFIDEHKKFPKSYHELVPKLHVGKFITLAPDDGQFIKINNKLELNEKLYLTGKIKLLEDKSSVSGKSWKWKEFQVTMPWFIADKQEKVKKPDIRINDEGQVIIDYKTEIFNQDKYNNNRVLSVDYGLRKLLTITCFEMSDEGLPIQLSRPFFVDIKGVQNKIELIHQDIDRLKAKLSKTKDKKKIKVLKREVKLRWKKLKKLSKELEHLASNIIIEISKIYNCSTIVIEDLRGLNGKKFARRLNRRIYRTIRAGIFEKLKYKAELIGKTVKAIFPAHTSQLCPKCGKHGKHKNYGEFICPHCGYSGNRDYIATQNIARRFFKISLKSSTGFGYISEAASAAVTAGEFLSKIDGWINGWKKCLNVAPFIIEMKNWKTHPLIV
ncbi:transposase [Candidatus Magnetomoraceae bacterium gMMP-13]